jgi:hypothetical protein
LRDLKEEAFYLMYCMNGMTYNDVLSMPVADRKWYIRKLIDQLSREQKEIKKAR